MQFFKSQLTNVQTVNFIALLPYGKITNCPISQSESQNHYSSHVNIKKKQSEKYQDSQLFNVVCNQANCRKIQNRFDQRANYATWIVEHHNVKHPSDKPSFIIVSFWSTIYEKQALHTEYRLVSLNNLHYLKPKSKSTTKQRRPRCDYCSLMKTKLNRCGGCKIMLYCSKECQQKHWKIVHKQFCKKFRKRKNLTEKDKNDCRNEEMLYLDKLSDKSKHIEKQNREWLKLQGINEQKQKPKDELLFDGESRNEMVMNTQMEVIIDAFGEGDKKLNFKKWSKLVKETGIYDGHYPGGLIQFWFNMCEELGFVEEYLPSLNNGSYGSYVRKRNVDVEPILFGPRELVETFRNIAYIHAVYSARNTGKSVDYNCHSDTAYQKAFKMLMELYGHAQSILCAGETSFDDVCDAIINCIPFFTDRNLLAIIYDYSSEMGPSRSLQISWHKIRWYTVDECHKEFWTKYDVESDVLYDIHYICKRDEKGYEDYMLNILICNDKKACEDKIKMCNEGKHYIVDRMEMMGKIKKWCLGNCAAYIPNYSFQLKHHAVLILKILQLYKLKPKLCHVIYVGKEVRCGYKEKGDIVAEFNKISGAKTLWKSHKRKHSNMLQELMGGSFPFM
eukprot:553417_1